MLVLRPAVAPHYHRGGRRTPAATCPRPLSPRLQPSPALPSLAPRRPAPRAPGPPPPSRPRAGLRRLAPAIRLHNQQGRARCGRGNSPWTMAPSLGSEVCEMIPTTRPRPSITGPPDDPPLIGLSNSTNTVHVGLLPWR